MDIPKCYYRVSIKGLLTNAEGKFLLCRESNGSWELPGGGLDHGETHEECLRREILEEMGVEVQSYQAQPAYVTTSLSRNNRWVINVLYHCTVTHLDFTPSDECQEIGFFTVEEARNMDLFPNVQAFIEQYDSQRVTTSQWQ